MSELPEDFKRLLVRPLEIYSGETGMVVLCKLRRKVDKLIQQHNKLVERMAQNNHGPSECDGALSREKEIDPGPRPVKDGYSPAEPHPKQREAIESKERHVLLGGVKEKWLNRPLDVIDLLIQMRYTCQCVAPVVTWLELTTYRFLWCKDCNRPYLEKED